jgi:SAM-dependent methyltransferase
MKDHNNHKYKGIFRGFFHQLYTIDLIRYFIARIRFFFLVRIFRRLKTFSLESNQEVPANTVPHNLKGLKDLAVVRSLALIKPVTGIDRVGTDSKVLTIGPRTEGEMFSLVGYGFMPKNIRGLDLISYSKWIDLGDMHNMPYEDNSYDVVIMGWVISYSDEPSKAAAEVIRVAKDKAIIAVGVEYPGDIGKKQVDALDYVPGAGRLTTKASELLSFFGDHVDHVYFSHQVEEDRTANKGSIIAVFSIKK